MTTLTPTRRTVTRKSTRSDFSVLAILARLKPAAPTTENPVAAPGRLAPNCAGRGARHCLPGVVAPGRQQSSVGLDLDTSLTGRDGLCSQRLAPNRHHPI